MMILNHRLNSLKATTDCIQSTALLPVLNAHAPVVDSGGYALAEITNNHNLQLYVNNQRSMEFENKTIPYHHLAIGCATRLDKRKLNSIHAFDDVGQKYRSTNAKAHLGMI